MVIDGATLKVRPNLHNILLRIRQKAFKLPIWIDAICINQEDETEKVQQIQLMSQIYSTAESVIIWLGEESSYTRQAAKALKKIERRFIDDGYFDRTQMTRNAERGIGEMLTSPWFNRLWVLQEAIKARHRLVLCGSHSIDLEALGFAANYFRDNGLIASYLKDNNTELALTGFGCIQEIQQFETSIRIGEWWPATDMCRERGCSQPKDRIYAIHGIVPGIHERMQGIRSYRFEPTTTVKDLYVPFTAMHLDPFGRTIRTAPAKTRDPTLPSWCPDYHQSRIHEPVDLDIRSDMAEEYKKLSGEDVIGRGKPYSWNQNKSKRLFVDALLVDEVRLPLGRLGFSREVP
ncbi:hypothetical protein M409DRAFT_25816 [Zasmidium cellare ATCC 36951]|uniref:Heterokaryon incompatibility domain-containing protein n=1 Tax=Zasmidium cellare ATCC 36951 TaxID=1080233 RepID=A0A6A6CA27_ZASCE|nr:uncharacterized protein M409DRAFT_25816 [Zasmidium cellare ATCC 36951]KAF2164047.1 hypothetical protein M409DRAFT_25816 [Zasmidium cellare ATCC 36951]